MKRVIIYLILSTYLISSCQKLLYDGEEKTREIFFSDFHAVIITGIYNIILIQDSTNHLLIKGKNDIGSVEAIVNKDTLIIRDNTKRSFNIEKNTLELHFSNIRYMVTNSPVNITNRDTIRAETFEYGALGEIAEVSLVLDCKSLSAVTSANTLGYLRFFGKANTVMFWARYGSSFFAGELLCSKAEINNHSAGDIYVNVLDEMKVLIRGSGNIYYYGTPKIEIAEKKGEGKLIRVY